MPGVLIIGIGNPLRGDDGLGWQAVDQLRERLLDNRIDFIVCHQLTPDLAEAASRAHRVIFIDARLGHPAGQLEVRNIRSSREAEPLGHQLAPPALLRYSQVLYGATPEAIVCSITAESYDYSLELSPAVCNSLPLLIDRVRQLALTPVSPRR